MKLGCNFYLKNTYCPGEEAMVSIVSAAADPLYRIPMWIFDCVLDKCLPQNK